MADRKTPLERLEELDTLLTAMCAENVITTEQHDDFIEIQDGIWESVRAGRPPWNPDE
jgi:hypothetical protein